MDGLSTVSSVSILQIVSNLDAISQFILFTLIAMSVFSWTVFISKTLKLRYITYCLNKFDNLFWSSNSLNNLYTKTSQSNDRNPLSTIFLSSMIECKKDNVQHLNIDLKNNLKVRIQHAIHVACNRETIKLEKNLNSLAMIGSTAPFIGILGMVWSIINSFHAMSHSQNINISTIAPSISEALFITAVGLAVAIPATIFHNLLTSKSDNINNKVEEFSCELYTLLSHSIDYDRI